MFGTMNFINGISRRTLRVVLSTVMMFVAAFFVRAQESSLRIYYKFDNATVYTDYLSNPASFAKLDEIVSSSSASNGFEIVTFSSPEGNFEYNARLAARRAESLRNWVYGKYPQLNGKVSIRPNAESWEDLRLKVESDSRLSSDVRSRILNIIDSDKAADAKETSARSVSRRSATPPPEFPAPAPRLLQPARLTHPPTPLPQLLLLLKSPELQMLPHQLFRHLAQT